MRSGARSEDSGAGGARRILVTGAAGFIGFHLVRRLVARGDEVVGLDNVNDYYDVGLKHARLADTGIDPSKIGDGKPVASSSHPGYRFIKLDLADDSRLTAFFEHESFKAVCHLAAQPGVRYGQINPRAYVASNLVGFANILEASRRRRIGHFVYASSSSVYGGNENVPYSTQHNVDHPVSLYAATKKSNELLAHAASTVYGLPTTGLRFFTVYGPWGRPDMAYFLFTRAILEDRPIDIFNRGDMRRDFTYVDDVIEGVIRVIDRPPSVNPKWSGLTPDPSSSRAPYRVYNIGNGRPVDLMVFVRTLEKILGRTARLNFLPMQAGDVAATWADTSDLKRDFGFRPETSLDQGLGRFVEWYRSFYFG
jgi:UDP-glucuronate 4-epimerase